MSRVARKRRSGGKREGDEEKERTEGRGDEEKQRERDTAPQVGLMVGVQVGVRRVRRQPATGRARLQMGRTGCLPPRLSPEGRRATRVVGTFHAVYHSIPCSMLPDMRRCSR